MPDYLTEALGGQMGKVSSIVTAGSTGQSQTSLASADQMTPLEEEKKKRGSIFSI